MIMINLNFSGKRPIRFDGYACGMNIYWGFDAKKCQNKEKIIKT